MQAGQSIIPVSVSLFSYQWEIPVTFATRDNTNMDKTRDDIHWLSKTSDRKTQCSANAASRGLKMNTNSDRKTQCSANAVFLGSQNEHT